MEQLDAIFAALKAKGIRVRLDDSDQSPGFKFNEWELKGVPVRIELGPRDLENNQALLKARDEDDKQTIELSTIVAAIEEELTTMQTRLLEKARRFREAHTHSTIDTLPQLQQHIVIAKENGTIPGWILAGWCGEDVCEEKVKEETKYTTRNIPFNSPTTKTTCICCGNEAKHTVWFAQAY